MTNQKKSDHYIYCLKDKHGVIRYIGQGRLNRYKSRNRTTKYLDILDDFGTVEIIIDGLSKQEALVREEELISEHKASVINRSSTSRINRIEYEIIKQAFVIDIDSPSGLARSPDYARLFGATFSKFPGSLDKEGYYRVGFMGKCYKCHRIVWSLHNKKDIDPDLVVDHLDGNKSNNNPDNLQVVSVLENNTRYRWKSDREPSYSPSKGTYIACVIVGDETRYRSFSTSKYGDKQAYSLAKNLLDLWLSEMRSKN